MRKIVECIPNFSEGRRADVLDQIVAAIKSVPGTVLLDRESDPDHNRSVVTFVAEPGRVVEAAVRGAKRAAELIDLNNHKGEHPRMGATDVIPFVPITGVTMEDCIQLARQCGKRLWQELAIPVYLYEKAATRPERENLAAVRKGQFEGIREEIKTNPGRRPDFGEPRVHPSAGITAVGARPPLIAYNVNLGTSNIEIANKIARAVRHQNGGLRYVKALGFELKDRGIVQVSMNMVNYQGTPLFRAFELIKLEAERFGVPVLGSEIVGLVPQEALNQAVDFYLQLENFNESQILEHRLQTALGDSESHDEPDRRLLADTTGSFAVMVAASTPTPGGGSVAAYCGQLATSLGIMVSNLTLGKAKYADSEARVTAIKQRLEHLAMEFRSLIDQDAESFESVLAAYRHPKETELQKQERKRLIRAALRQAADTPYHTAERSVEALGLLAELARLGNRNALSDVGTGAQIAKAAARGAYYNVLINLSGLEDEDAAEGIRSRVSALIDEADSLSEQIEAVLIEHAG
jgi:glutamate formiminotransferase/formiminotetrahydrofolate cyclodeaminase